MAGFVLSLVFRSKNMIKRGISAETTGKIIGISIVFSFTAYLISMILTWKHYEWIIYVDNSTDKNIELVVNKDTFFILANSCPQYDFEAIKIQSPSIDVTYKGQKYHFTTPSRYVFNVDTINNYYLIKHKIQYHTPTMESPLFTYTITDSIIDTVKNQMFFRMPFIDSWFKYPKIVQIPPQEKRNKLDSIYSLQRINEYEDYKQRKEMGMDEHTKRLEEHAKILSEKMKSIWIDASR
jgi:hypothetical protein